MVGNISLVLVDIQLSLNEKMERNGSWDLRSLCQAKNSRITQNYTRVFFVINYAV